MKKFMSMRHEFLPKLSSNVFVCLSVNLFLHSGTYGRLLHCSLNDAASNSLQNTYGKTLQSTANASRLNRLLHDACLFATLRHSTINSPLGIVYKENLSPYPMIIYPFSNRGILKRFLIQNRYNTRDKVRFVDDFIMFLTENNQVFRFQRF